MEIKFEKNLRNYIAQINDNYYIRYDSNPAPEFGNNGVETALRVPGIKFYIVELDLRKELEKCSSLQEVIDIFVKYNPGKCSDFQTQNDLLIYIKALGNIN